MFRVHNFIMFPVRTLMSCLIVYNENVSRAEGDPQCISLSHTSSCNPIKQSLSKKESERRVKCDGALLSTETTPPFASFVNVLEDLKRTTTELSLNRLCSYMQ